MDSTRRSSLADRVDWFIGWLYPPRCRHCRTPLQGRDEECFCPDCRGRIELVRRPLCTVCGRPFLDASGDDHLCGACITRLPRFTQARAWACYPRDEGEEHPLREAVHTFKYGRKVSLGKPLGRLMACGCAEYVAACAADVIIPVPLHPKRLRWRGFNQSVLLANQVSRVCVIPMDPFILSRTRETATQTQLAEQDRRRNVRGAFALDPEKPVTGKRILLVDDIYTSGATVNECSWVLRRGGAREVFVLTLARTVT